MHSRSATFLAAASFFLAGALAAPSARASSMREAPFIDESPKVDGSELYFFRSYEAGRSSYVVILANYQPLEEIHTGPLWFQMDPSALYELHLDNVGDCREHLTFQFRFQNKYLGRTVKVGDKNVPSPFLFSAPISAEDESGLNLIETYTLTVVRGNRRTGVRQPIADARTGETVFRKAPDYYGQKVEGDGGTYRDYARTFIRPIVLPGCPDTGRVLVAQRDDHFMENLGRMFDLFNTDIADPNNTQHSSLHAVSSQVLELELPIDCLLSSPDNPVLGAWSTASLRQARVLRPRPSLDKPDLEGGPWVQVSRVGSSFVNMFMIGLPDKDRFNAGEPKDDAQFMDYFTHPTLPVLLQQRYGLTPPALPRRDLAAFFLSGLPGLNQTEAVCDMLRLNTGVPPVPRGSQLNSGALACYDPGPVFNPANSKCDLAGAPNGRRPGDDVADAFLKASMGFLLPPEQAPDRNKPYNDGVFVNDQQFFEGMPYEPTPHGIHNEGAAINVQF